MVRSLFLAFRRGGRPPGLTLRLRAILGQFYRISLGGMRVLRGDKPYGAEELQRGFVDAMIRAGEL